MSPFRVQANVGSQALNSVYMVYDHFALLFRQCSVQRTKSTGLQSNSGSHYSAPSIQAGEDGILPNQDSQTLQLPLLSRGLNVVPDSWEGPGDLCADFAK
jgi:hypothetical protein